MTLNSEAELQEQLINVLDRRIPIDTLGALIAAIRPIVSSVSLDKTAIGLDANVFLRLSGHSKSVDIVDYLQGKHLAPLILPGQAVQEFWNNQLQAVDTVVSGLRKKFEQVKSDFSKVDKTFGPYAEQIDSILSNFSTEHGHLYDEATVRKTLSLFEMLKERASVPYAPRSKLLEIATQRKKSKTPPGFKDDGDGDFFIWADFLTGLQTSKSNDLPFDRAVLVSHDQKIDWSRAGTAHPILTAEVRALVGVPFEMWTIERLASEIGKVT